MNRHLWRRRSHATPPPARTSVADQLARVPGYRLASPTHNASSGYQAGRAHEYDENRRQINAVLMQFGLAPIEAGPLDLEIRDRLDRMQAKAKQQAEARDGITTDQHRAALEACHGELHSTSGRLAELEGNVRAVLEELRADIRAWENSR